MKKIHFQMLQQVFFMIVIDYFNLHAIYRFDLLRLIVINLYLFLYAGIIWFAAFDNNNLYLFLYAGILLPYVVL